MPSIEITPDVRKSCKHLVFADEEFDKPNDIDLLLGAELFHEFYDGRRLELGPGLPVALHSVFGWVITGKLESSHRPPHNTTSSLLTTLALDQTIKRFWEIEEPPVAEIKNPDDEKCEQLYSKLVTRNPDGRYVVPILLKEPTDVLGNSYTSSLKRLFNLERRFVHNRELKENYINFMREYSNLDHMKLVERPMRTSNIIPHHCVVRPDSSTTKLRVVFDGSAKTSNGKALNDLVYIGPKLQNDIVDIVTKFRIPKVVFTADISKMYRNIQLRPEDRIYQHILWRDSSNDPVSEFELTTVTYGVSSSPYLAIRTLHQLADDHGAQWPQAAAILKHDTFMDDITAGAPSLEEAVKLKTELVDLLDCGKFELRKWSSNSLEFLSELPIDHCQIPKPFCDESNQHTLKILGIQWDPCQDRFTYTMSELDKKCTKRIILSNIARIYDPLGWLTPVVLIAKLLMQQLWRLQLQWDEPVPNEIQLQWLNFCSELQNLHKVQIPRRIITSTTTSFELIGFSDGSMKAYGCCIYLRSSDSIRTLSHLLIAKSRVAPLKLLTVNRLELLGAVLLARVLKHMFQLLHPLIAISKVTAFTDSSTVLSWLHIPPYKLKTFVSHRVIKVVDNIGIENWQHVSSHDNPADLCSRGSSCSEIVSSSTWWNGPKWLINDVESWPVQKQYISMDNIPELKKPSNTSLVLVNSEETTFISNMLDRSSSFSRTKRVIAWCLRFINNAKCNKLARITSGLTTDELEVALRILVKTEQTKGFSEEINYIKRQANCSRAIQKLNPYIDEMGLLRVGGRLKNSCLPQTAINPLLLPKSSRLSLLLIDYFHRLYLHCGPRTLQSLILRKFWILGIRNLIRSRLSKCVTCFKVNPKINHPLMGDLPPSRVQPSRCFQNIGIDFAGPFYVKESRRRNARINKAYICVIVCLAVKAIHIEVVSDLSTPAFIAALDRFVSRRGLCNQIVSDCGTNFVGAQRYLSEVNHFLVNSQEEICENLAKRQIIWNFNPPTGSHFGGIFESGVKSIKYHLKRVVGLQVLTFEELSTVVTKIEAVLNSRPLCVISSDPNEVDVLTPGHFLTGGPLVALPEPPLEKKHISARERWQMVQKITQCFWRIWQRDYLHTLQQRLKWFHDQENLKIGDVVAIVDQNISPLEWRLGKVVAIHPGSDGIVRVVTLRTEKGILKRPVVKVCPLPLSD
ncbi:hypothetical protein K1T71_010808 [Dendrolimus kikuchii]|uniref:Uncharacterized protein n=1 Tax=Dendrolimus kikuchii TaxID=765133 RepID=A0ACC1CPW5_9NEOP|nr:hypothetical protein K1T71_014777 [Dendrolimus kikuchii]KAJ0173659.1 hypothetical protein K1T71_010808 [Dendrolimus kikuchii]